VGEMLAGEGDVKKGERWYLGCCAFWVISRQLLPGSLLGRQLARCRE